MSHVHAIAEELLAERTVERVATRSRRAQRTVELLLRLGAQRNGPR